MGFTKRFLRTVLHSAAVCAGVGVGVAAYRYFNVQCRLIEFFDGHEIIAPPILAVLLSLIIWKTPFSLRYLKRNAVGIMVGIAVFAMLVSCSVMLSNYEWTSWYSSSCDRCTVTVHDCFPCPSFLRRQESKSNVLPTRLHTSHRRFCPCVERRKVCNRFDNIFPVDSCLRRNDETNRERLRFTFLFAWLALPITFAILRYYFSRKEKAQGQSPSTENNATEVSAEELITWAYDDKPSEKDHLGVAEAKAEKIANRLLKSVKEKGNATVGLRGQYGSGKTTITQLVSQKVAAKNQCVLFAEASAWGFDSTQSAQQYIIEQIVSTMTEAGFDTDSLMSIPKRYVRALSRVHSVFDFLSVFFDADNDPQKIIGKIDDVLTQEEKKVVLILEDLDRNEGADFQLDNILATLRRLRETKNISFIITGFYQSIEKDKQDDKSKNRITDFAKICGYVEDMSDIAYDVKFDLLSKIAEFHVKKKYPDDITISSGRQGESLTKTVEIDHPILTDETKLLLTPQTSGKEFYDYTDIYPSVALCSLIDTPRMIKMIIRDVDAAWDKLHGEVDYQHLLAISILRNTDIPLLSFMREKQPDYDKTEEFNKLMDQFVHWVTSQDNPIMREKYTKLYTRILAWCFRCGIVFDFDKIGNEYVPQDE